MSTGNALSMPAASGYKTEKRFLTCNYQNSCEAKYHAKPHETLLKNNFHFLLRYLSVF